MRICRAAAAALGLACAAPALAQQHVPPGDGMMADPCPARQDGLNFASPYIREYDWAWLCRYKAQNKLQAAPPRAVFIGDSITENWLRLSPAMFAGGIVDRGIGGQTSPQILVRFMQDVVGLHPRVVHIMIGTNDVAGNTGPTSPGDYAGTVEAMVDIAQAHGIAVVLGAIPPTTAFPWKPALAPGEQIVVLNRWLREFARVRGLAFADYWTALADDKGAMKPGLSSDGVHPTAAGYGVMEPIARAAIAEAESHAAPAR